MTNLTPEERKVAKLLYTPILNKWGSKCAVCGKEIKPGERCLALAGRKIHEICYIFIVHTVNI